MQILMLEIESSIKLFNLKEQKGSLKFESIEELQDVNGLSFSDETECIIIDSTAPNEPKLSLLLSKLIASDYKITTNNVPNAIKKINMDGKIIEHLDREEYIRLSTPSKATIGMIKAYFNKYASWSFNKFLDLNSSYYDQYQAVEPEVYLESK
jgi:2-C-methyl-D-erythritol 4-phosphate cytidylyltransferase